MEDRTLTPLDVSKILRISKNTVYELIKRGELNCYRVGKKIRIDLKDVENYKSRYQDKKQTPHQEDEIYSSFTNNLLPLSEEYHKNNFIICGQDILLDVLSRYLQVHPQGVRALRSYVGSYNGLLSLYLGKIQVATSHLWDGDSGEYNIPFVRRLLPGIPTVIIHLAYRMQGFYVAAGNPKEIKSWEDLKRKDITMVNREKGCGTRILLDEHLRLLNINANSINGYDRECLSHLAAASIISRHGADFAIGNEKTGLQVKNIDFIPLQKESYDLVLKKQDIDKPEFKAIIDILRSDSFKSELEGIGNYDLENLGDIIAEL